MDKFPFEEDNLTTPILITKSEAEELENQYSVSTIYDLGIDIAALADVTKYFAQTNSKHLTKEYKTAIDSLLHECFELQRIANYYFKE